MRIKKTHFFAMAGIFCVSFFPLTACSTHPILDRDISSDVTFSQDTVERSSNELLYTSNLKSFQFPTESELFTEAKFKNRKLYQENLSVLADWVSNDLSSRKKQRLIQNCKSLVGKYTKEFPLNETTLACAAWWVQERNDDIKFAKKANAASSNQGDFKNTLARVDVTSHDQANHLVQNTLQHSSNCAHKNETAALFFKMEKLLPDPAASQNINTLYTHLQKCLKPNEEPTEKVHLRAGLLYLLNGKTTLAQKALEKTQLESDPQENSRNLFWLGTLYHKHNPKRDPKENPYWKKLIHDYPISYASIIACQQMGLDPTSVLVSDDQIEVQNRIAGGWNRDNLEAFVFDILNASRERKSAPDWASTVARTTQTTDPDLLLYWALIEHRQKEYFNTIILVGKYTKYQKNFKASPTLLAMQFPTPYLHEIVQESSSVDPVLMLSLIRQESAFSSKAHSAANARGLMQVLPSTAKTVKRSIRADDLYNPKTNIMVGRIYLERLLKKYDGKVEYVLAAYNAGDMNLDKWRNRVSNKNMVLFSDYIPFTETRNYISIILRNYYWYNRLLQQKNDSFSKSVLEKSRIAHWKSDSIDALLTYSDKNQLTQKQKELLDKIYLFGSSSLPEDIPQQTALKSE